MDVQQNQIQAKVKGEFCFLVGDKEMHDWTCSEAPRIESGGICFDVEQHTTPLQTRKANTAQTSSLLEAHNVARD